MLLSVLPMTLQATAPCAKSLSAQSNVHGPYSIPKTLTLQLGGERSRNWGGQRVRDPLERQGDVRTRVEQTACRHSSQ